MLRKMPRFAYVRAIGVSRRPSNAPTGHTDRHPDTRTGVIRAALATDGLGFFGGGRYIGHTAAQRRSRAKSNGKCPSTSRAAIPDTLTIHV